MKEFKGIKSKWRNINNEVVRADYLGASYKICDIVKDMPCPATKEMGVSHAKLIASAPELLNALLYFLEHGEDRNSIKKAKKAIEKALN